MWKLGLVICLVGSALAGPPPVSKSQEEIQSFREALEKSRHSDGYRLSERMLMNPKANEWENSGKFQGDIILDQRQIDELVEDFAGTRKAYMRPNSRWPGNTVVFEFGAGEFTAPQQQAIIAMMNWISHYTCVRFRHRHANERNFVRLTGRPDGCYASMGFDVNRGVHTMNLARSTPGQGCFVPVIIVHEWFHVIGMFHMQSTYNRYNYVRIFWENIQRGMAFAFYRFDNRLVSNHGLRYEYSSCMHYGTHAFTTNGRATLLPTRPYNGELGQIRFVTHIDFMRVNRHYNCPGAWRDDIKSFEQLREIVHAEDVEPFEDIKLEDLPPQEYYVPEHEDEFMPEQEFKPEQAFMPEQEFVAEQQEYEPEQQEYEPEQQEYEPEQQEYEPEQQEYEPEQQEYEPEQQEYEPEQQEFAPEQQEFEPEQ
ncbi:zinc metalloproteinase nas-4-like isoform X1 [Epargyreus clarus]|uniref:zinc metalloproteinase nas-4-like isoform X1 n=2 Tax=Epargyreus clarus TaxID=520877 RepID=UPI003C2EFE8B